jgi:DNA-binding MarR family transcriptional regulator
MHGDKDPLAAALLDLARFFNDPRRDCRIMAEAGLALDPAFLPVLVRLGTWGPAGVVELAEELGRDHSTMSRQVAKLEAAGLAERTSSDTDARVRIARATSQGLEAVQALSAARRRALDQALDGWTGRDRQALGSLLGRFAAALLSAGVNVAQRP